MSSKIFNLGNIEFFEKPTEIFNGVGGTLNTTYSLNDDISKYKLLIVSTSCNNGTYNLTNRDSIVIDVDSIEHNNVEYRESIMVSTISGATYSVQFIFPDNNTIKIVALTKTGSWVAPKIHSIYGIK